MRIVFFGMTGRFSAPPLRALLDAGANVVAVAVPAPPGAAHVTELPVFQESPVGSLTKLGPANILQLAGAYGIPTLALRNLVQPAVAAALAALRPDIACVACWPWRIPPALLQIPRYGFLNIHPALLPAMRGPEPLFWALRSGHERGGVTLHFMDAELDTGDIVLQVELELPAGMSWAEAEERAARLGARLLVEGVRRLGDGNLARRPQGQGGRFLGAPKDADFTIDPNWSARHAFAFMRGTAAWGQPYLLRIGEKILSLGAAIGYEPAGQLPQPLVIDGTTTHVQMSPGVLVASLEQTRFVK